MHFLYFCVSNYTPMKYTLYILTGLFLIISTCGKSQNLDETSIKKMLQGDWVAKDEGTFTLTITNDTIMEISNGDHPGTDTFKYTVTKTNCSKDPLNGSLTGFYLNE